MTTSALAGSVRPWRRIGLITTVILLTLATSGCFRLVNKDTYAIGLETNRANLVVHTNSTRLLQGFAKSQGVATSRSVIIGQVPSTLPITTNQRLAICAASAGLCLTADQIGRTLVSWFKSDLRNRSDYWESLNYAAEHGRCFAWTFAPSRNLTHKGIGTSGCGRGKA